MKKIYTQLKEDHREVKSLLSELVDSSSRKDKVKLLEKITAELTAHNEAEEDIFYVRLNETEKGCKLQLEGEPEHRLATQMLQELKDCTPGSVEFLAKAKVLKDLVEHHVEEEESEIHKEAKKIISDEEAEELTERFLAIKKEKVNSALAA